MPAIVCNPPGKRTTLAMAASIAVGANIGNGAAAASPWMAQAIVAAVLAAVLLILVIAAYLLIRLVPDLHQVGIRYLNGLSNPPATHRE